MNKYYPGEPVNIHIQSRINIIQENNWVIATKNGKGKVPLFCGNVEWVIPINGQKGTKEQTLRPSWEKRFHRSAVKRAAR